MRTIAAIALTMLASTAFAHDLRNDARLALRKAAGYFHDRVAQHGGYVYYVSLDLEERWGEGKATRDTIFVQPPGTPSVGLAFLKAYEATGDRFYLDAARDAANALVYGQLESGGWTQTIHFGPAARLGKYRHGKGGNWNVSSLDDGQSQAALLCLIRVDRALDFKDAKIHDAVTYGLEALLKAQFPSGGFPQVWTKPVEAKPVVKARFPEGDAKRIKNYWDYPTLNDGLAGSVAETLLEAIRVTGDAKYSKALAKLGDFLILAQMPDPQPAWCQQYDDAMVPMWARKFEPLAITGWESQDAIETLIAIARQTGDPKYLEPIPRALAYLKSSRLKDGRLARFYEFQTNRPLFMDGKYQLTYDASAAPGHYGWTQPSRLDALEADFLLAKMGKPAAVAKTRNLDADVHRILKDLDGEGRWVSTYAGEKLVGQPKFAVGVRYLASEVFNRNVETLSEFISRYPVRGEK